MYVNSRVSKSAKQLFIMYFLDLGRFLCVNAYFGASIHLILFFVSNHGKQNRKKCGI